MKIEDLFFAIRKFCWLSLNDKQILKYINQVTIHFFVVKTVLGNEVRIGSRIPGGNSVTIPLPASFLVRKRDLYNKNHHIKFAKDNWRRFLFNIESNGIKIERDMQYFVVKVEKEII